MPSQAVSRSESFSCLALIQEGDSGASLIPDASKGDIKNETHHSPLHPVWCLSYYGLG